MDCSLDYLGMDPKFLNTIFNQHLSLGQPVDLVISVHPDSHDVDGEHFTSHTKRVHLQCLLAHGRKTTASVVIKTQKNWDNAIQTRNYNALFRTEIKMYTTLLPMMKDIMMQAGDEREALSPEIYGHQSADLIALQDLSGLGFTVHDRRTGLNANDSLLVVQNIARFHAMSKLLVDGGSVSLPSNKDSEIVVNQIFEALFVALCNCMETSWGEEWSPIMEWIRAQHNDVLRKVGRLQQEYDRRFAVVNHGDLWTSNIMFRKAESETTPTSVRFVDYQLSNVNSFIWDLEFFFWTSVSPTIRTTCKNALLTEYQKSLEVSLKLFGYSGYVPTLDDVTAESKRIDISGLVFLLFGAVARSDVPRALDMEKLMTYPPQEVVSKAIFSNQKALEIVGQDLKSLCQHGIIRFFPPS